MSLTEWLNNGWLKSCQPNKQKVRNLLNLIERDLRDCHAKELSIDWKFTIAYNAALACCQTALYCCGYEVARGQSGHYRIIQSIVLTLGPEFVTIRDYLNFCRNKRNIADYEAAQTIALNELQQLSNVAFQIKNLVGQKLSSPYLATLYALDYYPNSCASR